LAICYLALLVPVLGIMEHPHYPCDRYSLIVSICFSVLIAAFLANPKTKKPARYTAFFLSIVVIAILGTLSWRQTRVWNNSVSLFEHIIRTLGDDPYSCDIHDRLGELYAKQGQNSKAIEHFQKVIELNPNFIPEYGRLASIYVVQKDFDKAAACLEKAISVVPDSPETHFLLGYVYLFKQQPDKTILHWEKGIELEPSSILIMSKLAELLATYRDAQFRNPEEAIRLAKQCCELTEYKNPVLLNILASAMASANRFAEAIDFAEKALLITRATGQKELTAKILYRLNFYKANQPYIESPSLK
jgi:tetratricopeptide (TPR) repeat protein